MCVNVFERERDGGKENDYRERKSKVLLLGVDDGRERDAIHPTDEEFVRYTSSAKFLTTMTRSTKLARKVMF